MKLAENVKPLGLLFLAIPFMAMIFMIAMNHYRENNYQEYRIAIDGYDPRDLLKGHYIRFTYDWPENAVNKSGFIMNKMISQSFRREQLCVCFSGDSLNPDVRFDLCKGKNLEGQRCDAGVKVNGWGGGTGFQQPDETLRNYFVAEEHAYTLEKMLREGKHKFSVGIVPQPGGRAAALKMMYVDGIPLDEYLRSHLIVRPEPYR